MVGLNRSNMARKNLVKIEDDFQGMLFGIAAQVKDYQLCWNLNRLFGFDLKRMDDIEIIHRKKNKTSVFSLYRFEDDLDKCIVNVVSNKYLGEFLIPEIKQADYFLILHGEFAEDRVDEIVHRLKNISAVQMTIPVNYSGLKSKKNLIFE